VLLAAERAAVVATCQRLVADGLVVGTAGNVSVRAGELVAVTPSGLAYESLRPELVGVHRLDGSVVDGPLRPTSELPMHLAVYGAGAGVGAVVHTHPVAATALSCLVDEVPLVHYYTAMFGGPVRVAAYATYGTAELADNAVAALAGRTGCLLSNHGAITLGDTLGQAYDRARHLEWLCEVALRVIGTGRPATLLDPAEIDRVTAKLASYGQQP